ncbi:MAG: hypothetical protein GY711_14570 [bacterium]|nr:hypothetical protein [bacterium]
MNTGAFPFPGGSQGVLCLSNPIARFVTQVGQIAPNGTFTRPIDLTAIPMSPPVAVAQGDTWHFQCWFRDQNPGSTSNFSRPVSVTFR